MSSVTYEKTCGHCGRTFTANRMDAKFCSKRCGNAHLKSQLPPLVKKCKWCGKEFMRPRERGGRYRFCSEECAAAAERKRYRKYLDAHLAKLRAANAARLMVKCTVCGKEFFSPRGTAKYCSPRCRVKMNNIKTAERMKRRERLLEDVAPEDRASVEKSYKQLNRHERMYKKHFESGHILGLSRENLDDISNAIFED